MTRNNEIEQGPLIGTVAARGAVRGNGVIYVLVIGIVLAICAVGFAIKVFL